MSPGLASRPHPALRQRLHRSQAETAAVGDFVHEIAVKRLHFEVKPLLLGRGESQVIRKQRRPLAAG